MIFRRGFFDSKLRCLICALSVCASLAKLARADVVIHEIHYNTARDDTLEYVELHNTGASVVDLSGWTFVAGVRLELPEGTSIDAGGFLLVCGISEFVADEYSLPLAALVPWVGSQLDDGGERLELVDAGGRIVDELEYDDDVPWDTGADAPDASLQRVCSEAPAGDFWNWVSAAPTPLAANAVSGCPPPPPVPSRVAINEIYYHPPDAPVPSDEPLEYVELANTTGASIDLSGWSFTDGFTFVFPAGAEIGAGDFLVVCRNEAAIQSEFGIENTIGDYDGFLSNDGERLTLVDATGALVDSVRYEDDGDWAVAADSLGYSLEKIVPTAVSDEPASWRGSGEASSDSWRVASTTGTLTRDRLVFYLGGEGEMLIDDVSLVELDGGANHVPNGEFASSLGAWSGEGNHGTSDWHVGERALRLVSSGSGSSSNSVRVDLLGAPDVGGDTAYRLEFRYRSLSGNADLIARLVGSSPTRGLFFESAEDAAISPGRENNVRRDTLPPFIEEISREPLEPTSEDEVTIRVRVRDGRTPGISSRADSVRLLRTIDESTSEFDLRDDGLGSDSIAGDGVWAVRLPAQPHHTAVRLRLFASSAAGAERVSPPVHDPSIDWGYYVSDDQPDSPLPVYHLLVPRDAGQTTRQAIVAINCQTYVPIDFAHRGDLFPNVEMRRRGQSVCGDPDIIKKYLRVRFRRGRELNGNSHLNFQSLWTDKSLLREHLAWRVFREMGPPWIRHEYVRLHANGAYFGLYAEMERLDERFLERHGLDPSGSLYKAIASSEQRDGVYERKTGDESDFTDLRAFLDELHDTPSNQLEDFFRENVDEDAIIEYLGSHVLINNGDYGHKNHYLYRAPDTERWQVLAWDIDLSYGKRWDGQFGGVLNDRLNTPGISPWNGTTVNGGGVGNHLLAKFFGEAGTYYRRAHRFRLWSALREKYTPDEYERRVGELRELLFEEQQDDIDEWGRSPATADAPDAPAEFEPNLERLLDHIDVRLPWLEGYLRDRDGFRDPDRLKITEVMYNPAGSDRSEFVELWNNSGRTIDISGWSVDGTELVLADGSVRQFAFPDGTRLSDGEIVVLAKDPAALSIIHGEIRARVFGPYPGALSNGGERLKVRDDGPGHPAIVDSLVYDNDAPWPRRADGFGYSLELQDVEPDLDNDPAHRWRSSTELHGSPGRIHLPGEGVRFSRGDCNADGSLDISDPVRIVRHLFLGTPIDCAIACDANGDEELDVSDAIRLLDFFYGDIRVPLPAPGSDDCAPTDPTECAESTCFGV